MKPIKKRFSKQSITEELHESLKYFENKYNFSTRIGYAQVEGKGEEINRAYGAFYEIQCILSDL